MYQHREPFACPACPVLGMRAQCLSAPFWVTVQSHAWHGPESGTFVLTPALPFLRAPLSSYVLASVLFVYCHLHFPDTILIPSLLLALFPGFSSLSLVSIPSPIFPWGPRANCQACLEGSDFQLLLLYRI